MKLNNERRRSPCYSRNLLVIVAAMAMIVTGGCMSADNSTQTPPERDFDDSTAWVRMEEAVAEAIAGLPEFPGFEERRMLELACKHNGEVNEDYTRFELTYAFSAEDSATDLVHEEYVRLLREQWSEAGYDIHRDESVGEDPTFYDVEARRPDGVNYWLTAAHYTSLTIQSGCVKKSGKSSHCPSPLGGVTPENDIAGQLACGTAYDDPTEEADAIALFGGTQAAVVPFSADDTGHGNDQTAEPAPDRYSDEL